MNETERREHVQRMVKGSSEPEISPLNYHLDMIFYSNYHNANSSEKEKRAWLLKSLKHNHEDKLIPIMERATDFEIRHISILKRAKDRGDYISDEHLILIDKIMERLRVKYDKKPKDIVQAVAAGPTPEEKIQAAALKIIDDLETEIEKFVKNKTSEFSMKNYLTSNNVNPNVAKVIPNAYKKQINELREALLGIDKQLVEGYSNFKKVEIRRFAEFLQSIVDACMNHAVAKSTRVSKVRIPKVKPASVLVSKLRYLKEFTDLNMKSVDPKNIIGAQQVWLYNTKYRSIEVYKASEKSGLTVHGTKIKNFDVDNSIDKTIRKPEEFFKNLVMAKASLGEAMKNIRSKERKCNGAVSTDTIILKVF